MLSRLQFLNHGKNNNLHLNIIIGGTRKKPLFKLKLVAFFDTQNCYITNSNIHKSFRPILNFQGLTKIIQDSLNKKDFNLCLFSESDFFNKNVTSIQILNKINS